MGDAKSKGQKSKIGPSFLVAGAPRSGTGWLLSALREHPQIFMPLEEIRYFSFNYEKSIEWYHEFFDGVGSNKVKGEKSPSYIYANNAPQRIFNYNQNMKIIFVLRDPIDRAYSNYKMRLRGGDASGNIEKEMSTGSRIVDIGLYYKHISRYLKYFDIEDIKILIFEDVKNNPKKLFSNVCSFLGVDDGFEPSNLNEKYGGSRPLPKFRDVWKMVVNASMYMSRKSKKIASVLEYVRKSRVVEYIHRINSGEKYPKISNEKREELKSYYKHDVNKISEMLERELKWLE
jgi:hypothetical protein